MPEFYVILCSDNLLELLQFGCRRRLTKLERIGRRFYLMIEKYLGVIPFIRLNIQLNAGYSFFFRHKQIIFVTNAIKRIMIPMNGLC